MAEFSTIIFEQEGPVAQITINRPDKLNALNIDVIGELGIAIFEEIGDDVRVLVITGAGDKAFVAGADISPMAEMSPQDALEFSRQGQLLFSAMEKMSLVTIAKVRGFALGGGCELAMACDLIVATAGAKFGQPEVNLGIIPGFGGTQRLVRRVGLPVALDMLLCGRGRTLSGEEAFSLGLVSRVVSDERLDDEVAKMIKSILACGPQAVAETKRLCRQSLEMSLEAGLASEAAAFANSFATAEAEEGITAFLEKRQAEF
jgi:enoyl-CoA hydratase